MVQLNTINIYIVPLHIVFVNKKTTKYSVITEEKAKIPPPRTRPRGWQ